MSAFFASKIVFEEIKKGEAYSLFGSSQARYVKFLDLFQISRALFTVQVHLSIVCVMKKRFNYDIDCCFSINLISSGAFSLVLCGFIFLIDVKKY